MPRIAPSLVRQAVRRLGPEAALLLPACRNLASTRAELRWLTEHVRDTAGQQQQRQQRQQWQQWQQRLRALCRRRGRGEPLQYVLGTQPFGPLDLLCRRGVLIPRPEPEAYAIYLADILLRESRDPVAVLDVCTGSGCIALLLSARLRAAGRAARVLGMDVAPAAVALARANAVRNRLGDGNASTLSFFRADAFADDWLPQVPQPLHVLIANPPYVSAAGFAHDAARSVRLFEPKLAQVPLPAGDDTGAHPDASAEPPHDRFYGRLLALAARLDARLVLCEVGSLAQAQRVVARALGPQQEAGAVCEAEIWRDAPDIAPDIGTEDADAMQSIVVASHTVRIRGSGHARSVFLRRR